MFDGSGPHTWKKAAKLRSLASCSSWSAMGPASHGHDSKRRPQRLKEIPLAEKTKCMFPRNLRGAELGFTRSGATKMIVAHAGQKRGRPSADFPSAASEMP
jgi:hypothetical protein